MNYFDNKSEKLKNTLNFGNQLSENNDQGSVTKKFHQGAIYYRPVMGKSAQAVLYIYEDKYENCKQIAVESSFLGFPVSEQITDNHGISISYFESGAIVGGIGIPEPIICRYTFPKITNPGIVSPSRSYEIKNFIRGKFDHIKQSVYDLIIQRRPHFFEEIFSNNLFLKAVSSNFLLDDVLLFPEIEVEHVSSTTTNEKEATVSISFKPSSSESLQDGRLFNISFRSHKDFVVAPHAIFSRENWDNFGIIHATDIHVSRRLEYIKDDLKKMSVERPESRSRI